MKLFLAFLLTAFAANAFCAELDTLPNWNFYYKKHIVMEGSSGEREAKRSALEISEEKPGELVATFNYDVSQTFESFLEIRKGNTVVRRIEYKANPSGNATAPSVKTGSTFVIPLNDVLEGRGDVELDFYYSDEYVKELRLGTISFHFSD